jgi:hypothetical protein
MPQPTHSDLHVSRPLTDLSVAYANEMTSFVFDKVFPVVTVQKQADQYFTYDKGDWLRTDAERRAPGAEVALTGWNVSTDTYFCERYAVGHDIADPERANADPAVQDLDGDTVANITEDLRIRHEKDFLATFFTTSVWDGASSTTDMTGSSTAPGSTAANFLQWNDAASTPIEDLRGEITAVQSRTARKPNTLVLGARVWTALADHPDLLDRIKYTQRGIVGPDLLAALLGIDRVLVAASIENTAGEAQPESTDFQAGKHALLAYVAPRPGLRTPSAGYTFSWTSMYGVPSSGAGGRVKRYRLERNESDRIEIEAWRDYKVVSSQLGAFFSGAVA